MAHYSVDTSGGKVEFDSPHANLSPEEIDQIVNENHPEGEGYKVPGLLQKVAQGITGLGRVSRAGGVFRQRMIENPGDPKDALAQAFMASQPGFKAGPGQRLGAFAGGMADPINLAANFIPGGTFMKSLGTGALMGGFANAADQMSAGRIDPSGVAGSALAGAGIGGLTHGMASLPGGFLKKAPEILETNADIPKRATTIFMANKGIENEAPSTREAMEQLVKDKSQAVQDALESRVQRAQKFFARSATRAKINDTTYDLAKSKPMSRETIVNQVQKIKQELSGDAPKVLSYEGVDIPLSEEALKNPEIQKLMAPKGNMLKRLFDIRTSISHHMGPNSDEKFSAAQKGLTKIREEVNGLIEQTPKGKILRRADKVLSSAFDMQEKLTKLKESPGKVREFLKNVFENKGPDSEDDYIHLMALEKATGKPVINDLYKALTMSHFSQPLAGNKFSRSVAGLSPFLISAALRTLGLPFQAALALGTGGVTAARSPMALGALIRGAQAAEKPLATAAGPTATTALNAIRQRWKD